MDEYGQKVLYQCPVCRGGGNKGIGVAVPLYKTALGNSHLAGCVEDSLARKVLSSVEVTAGVVAKNVVESMLNKDAPSRPLSPASTAYSPLPSPRPVAAVAEQAVPSLGLNSSASSETSTIPDQASLDADDVLPENDGDGTSMPDDAAPQPAVAINRPASALPAAMSRAVFVSAQNHQSMLWGDATVTSRAESDARAAAEIDAARTAQLAHAEDAAARRRARRAGRNLTCRLGVCPGRSEGGLPPYGGVCNCGPDGGWLTEESADEEDTPNPNRGRRPTFGRIELCEVGDQAILMARDLMARDRRSRSHAASAPMVSPPSPQSETQARVDELRANLARDQEREQRWRENLAIDQQREQRESTSGFWQEEGGQYIFDARQWPHQDAAAASSSSVCIYHLARAQGRRSAREETRVEDGPTGYIPPLSCGQVDQLVDMGFDHDDVVKSMNACENDLDRALTMLLQGTFEDVPRLYRRR